MTSSRIGLAVLTVIALALGVVLALDTPPVAVARSTRVLPGLDAAQVVRVTWDRGGAQVVVERGERGWRVASPPPLAGPADEAVIADVLGALELASAVRWGGDAPAAGLTVTAEAPRDDATGFTTWALQVGAPDDASGFARVSTAQGRAATVEAWVARALDRAGADLRRRVVVATASPTGVELHAGGVDLVLSGVPAVANGVRVRPALVAALIDALGALRLATILPPRSAPDRPGTIRVLGGDEIVEIEDLGACPGAPDHRALGGTIGTGCVSAAAWDAVIAAARAITIDPVDPVPLSPAAITKLTLADGAVIEPKGGDWIAANAELDATRVRALLDALTRPATVSASPATDAPPLLVVTHADGATDTLVRVDATHVRRAGEPYALAVPADVIAQLARGLAAVVDTTLLVEDPYLLRAIEVVEAGRTTRLTMGDTFDAWTATTGTADVAAILALRDLVANLAADELGVAAPGAPRRTLTLHFDPEPTAGAQPTSYTLAITKDCVVTLDDVHARLSTAACRVLLASLTR